MLPFTDFSGKNSVTCRDQAGQSQGDAVCHRTGWRQDRECQEPPNTAPSPQRPLAWSTGHTPPCQHIFHTLPARSFDFPLCLEGPGSRRVSHAPSPKAAWGWVTATQHKGMRPRLGQEEPSKGWNCAGAGEWGLQPGGMGETAGSTGCRTWWVPRRCPRGGGQAVPTAIPCCGAAAPGPAAPTAITD